MWTTDRSFTPYVLDLFKQEHLIDKIATCTDFLFNLSVPNFVYGAKPISRAWYDVEPSATDLLVYAGWLIELNPFQARVVCWIISTQLLSSLKKNVG